MSWYNSAEGIVRVEMGIANYFLTHTQDYSVRFFIYQPNRYEWIVKRIYSVDPSIALMGAKEISTQALKAHIDLIENWHISDKVFSIPQGGKIKIIRKTASSILNLFGSTKTRSMDDTSSLKKLIGKWTYYIITYFNLTNVLEFKHQDRVLTVGAFWNIPFYLDYISAIKSKYKIHFMCTVHDIIPIVVPFYFRSEDVNEFRESYLHVLNIADTLICVSHATQRDVIAFSDKNGYAHLKTFVSISGSNPAVLSDSSACNDTLLKLGIDRPYILMVSTFAPRKNHRILSLAYQLLISEGREDMPMMVWVGKVPDKEKPFFNSLNVDILINKGLLKIFHDISDDELNKLYQCCQYTVFPSLYEGWGLPVAESLGYGKYCLCANTSSLPEVGQHFVDYLNPFDTRAWADAMLALQDKSYLNELTDYIKKNYKPYTWEHAGRQLADFLNAPPSGEIDLLQTHINPRTR